MILANFVLQAPASESQSWEKTSLRRKLLQSFLLAPHHTFLLHLANSFLSLLRVLYDKQKSKKAHHQDPNLEQDPLNTPLKFTKDEEMEKEVGWPVHMVLIGVKLFSIIVVSIVIYAIQVHSQDLAMELTNR